MDPSLHQQYFHFLRSTPDKTEQRAPLISSLQAFETSLFLLSSCRFAHALVMCASAIESALKAKLELEESDKYTPPSGGFPRPYEWRDLHNEVRNQYGYGKSWHDSMKSLFNRRNSIIHYGYTPEGEKDATRVLLQDGYPLLSNYYIALFDFYLDYKDLMSSKSLTANVAKCDPRNALVPDIADLWSNSKEIFNKAKNNAELDLWYCFYPLLTKIQHMTSRLTIDEYDDGSMDDILFDEYSKKTSDLRSYFGDNCWNFDCPVCFSGYEKLISEFDNKELENGRFGFLRAKCVRCGFSVMNPDQMPYMIDIIIQDQVSENAARIMEYWKSG
jgi:hypothetical protein